MILGVANFNEGDCLGGLGITYHFSDNAKQAIAYYEQALVIAREIGDQRGRVIIWATWGLPTTT